MDFYYASRAHAQKFVDFLQAVVPVRFRHDRSLVSHDKKSNTFNYKYTFSVEMVPICKVRWTRLSPLNWIVLGRLGMFASKSKCTLWWNWSFSCLLKSVQFSPICGSNDY